MDRECEEGQGRYQESVTGKRYIDEDVSRLRGKMKEEWPRQQGEGE